jgi:hypothetical protein
VLSVFGYWTKERMDLFPGDERKLEEERNAFLSSI